MCVRGQVEHTYELLSDTRRRKREKGAKRRIMFEFLCPPRVAASYDGKMAFFTQRESS